MMAFLNFLITASTGLGRHLPLTNWSSNSDGISGNVTATAPSLSLMLRGIISGIIGVPTNNG
jgi:hypothetical protein